MEPRDLRHWFVSLMSAEEIPLEEISRLVGHSNIEVTEQIYRQDLRPVFQAGTKAIDALFVEVGSDVNWTMDALFRCRRQEGTGHERSFDVASWGSNRDL